MKNGSGIPQFQWKPFQYRVLQCYTPDVRKMERFTTVSARNEKKYCWNPVLNPDRQIDHVGACLLQENQFTHLAMGMANNPNTTSAQYDASDWGQHAKGPAVAFFIKQLSNGHFEFCFYAAIGKKLVCTFQYCSEVGRYDWNCSTDKNEPYKQNLSIAQYLKKMPDTIVLDEAAGKILHKNDLLLIFDAIEHNQNDWGMILLKLEKLLYGRCFPLEYPEFEMKTPSTCPEGYELIDRYDAVKWGLRTEIYYRTADKERLPKYKR